MSNSVFQQNVNRIKFAVFLMVLRFTRRATSSIADCYALEAGAATVSPPTVLGLPPKQPSDDPLKPLAKVSSRRDIASKWPHRH